jgi:hypothetical protein
MGQMARDAFEVRYYPVRAQEKRLLAAKGILRGMQSWYAAYEDKGEDMSNMGQLLEKVHQLVDRFHGKQRNPVQRHSLCDRKEC